MRPNPPMRSPAASVLALLLLLAAPAARADAAPAAVPSPDLSKLPPQQAEALRKERASFEKGKEVLIGDPLAESYALLGAAYARNGFLEPADVAFADAMAIAPNVARWPYMRGLLATMRKQDAAAKGYFERSLSLDPTYLPTRTALANLRMAGADLDGARWLIEAAPGTQRDQAVPQALLGEIALRQKRYPDAINGFKRALELAPEASRLNALLADAYAGSGDAKAAAAARAKAGDGMPALYDAVGSRLIPAGEAGAGGDKARAPRTTSGDPRREAIGEAMALAARQQFDGARRRLDEALRAMPNDAQLLESYAYIEALAGNFSAAQSRIAASLAADPKSAIVRLTEGLIGEMRNDDASAQRAYEQAVRLQPASAQPRIALGTLFMRQGKLDDAIAQFRAGTRADPENNEAWARLVGAYFVAGRCRSALDELNAALGKKPNDGNLLRLFVRATSTCPDVGDAEKRMALDYGGKLYKASNAPSIAETYALALAANGKWDDAVKTQEAAMFLVVRDGGTQAVRPYQDFLRQFRAHTLPRQPWPTDSALLKPLRPQPSTAAAAAK